MLLAHNTKEADLTLAMASLSARLGKYRAVVMLQARGDKKP